ncbi:MAG TPA: hypothetical protein PKY58_04895 [Syntrophales bacterium]|nr:hypothetical protein [Syntrophales bacterium]HQN77984.1 hypothetical protein [Syntrophales bacterium]HQQ26844.1 hypothetical protein [Syntrophales bacterium]
MNENNEKAVKSEKDELMELKDRRSRIEAKIANIQEKAKGNRIALEFAKNEAESVTKRIAAAVANSKPLKDLREKLAQAQNEVAFLSVLAEEFETDLLDQAKRELKEVNIALEEAFIRILEPQRKAAIDEALQHHARLEEIKRGWVKTLSDLSTEYQIGGFTFMESLMIHWEAVLPMGHIDPRILAATRGSRE